MDGRVNKAYVATRSERALPLSSGRAVDLEERESGHYGSWVRFPSSMRKDVLVKFPSRSVKLS